MSPQSKGLSHSVQVRLVAHSKAIGMEPLFIFTRYAIERFLYRLSRSPHVDRFVLKGALLMLVWLGETIRPTRDVDFLGLGDLPDASLAQIFSDICLTPVDPDGVEFDPLSLRIAQIRQEDAYGGKRVTFAGASAPFESECRWMSESAMSFDRARCGSSTPASSKVPFRECAPTHARFLRHPGTRRPADVRGRSTGSGGAFDLREEERSDPRRSAARVKARVHR